jgi:hypothetical protein
MSTLKKKCCLLVLNSVTSPPRWIRQPQLRAIPPEYQRCRQPREELHAAPGHLLCDVDEHVAFLSAAEEDTDTEHEEVKALLRRSQGKGPAPVST